MNVGTILFRSSMVNAVREYRKTETRRVVVPQPVLDLDGDDLSKIGLPETRSLGYFSGNTPYRWSKRDMAPERTPCPYGQPGDRLLVKETFFAWGRWETRFSEKKGRDEWHFVDMTLESGKEYRYAADGVSDTAVGGKRHNGVLPMYWKRPAIFMPHRAVRITLEVTGVRMERLQAISATSAEREGLICLPASGRWVVNKGEQYFGGASHDPVEVYSWLWRDIHGSDSWSANPLVWVVEFEQLTS